MCSIRTSWGCVGPWDNEWWRLRQAIGLSLDPRQRQLQWRHGVGGRRAHWEDTLVRLEGDSWQAKCLEPKWAANADQLVRRALKHFRFSDKIFGQKRQHDHEQQEQQQQEQQEQQRSCIMRSLRSYQGAEKKG